MNDHCEFIEKCPMFAYFSRSAEDLYRYAYCEGEYGNCERRTLRLAGETVPDSLLPQGIHLWNEAAGEEPPVYWIS